MVNRSTDPRPFAPPVRRNTKPSTTGLGRVARITDWRERAACREQDPELFFPIGNLGPLARLQIEEAKAVCELCEVSSACLTWAIANNIDHGVWGGRSEEQRRTSRRKQAAQSRGRRNLIVVPVHEPAPPRELDSDDEY